MSDWEFCHFLLYPYEIFWSGFRIYSVTVWDNYILVFLGPKGVLEYIGEGNLKYYKRLKDIFFGILINIWLFWVLITDLESSGKGDLE